jgi:hypothetical protein
MEGKEMKIIKKIRSFFRYEDLKDFEKQENDLVSELEGVLDYPENENAGTFLQYARDNFTELKLYTENIEKKADDLIKYLGIGTGFLGFIIANSLWRARCGNQLWILWIGFMFWVFSLLFAVLVRMPTKYLYPDSIYSIYSQMHGKGYAANTAKTILFMTYERAKISHFYRGRRKARALNVAYFFLVFSLVFILCFCGIILI